MAAEPEVAPYGTWESPVSSQGLAADRVALDQPSVVDGHCFWLEGRAFEGGRVVLVREGRDLTPAPFNVRSRVHEYGGGAYTVAGDVVLFVNFADQRLFRIDVGQPGEPQPLTPESGAALRYADLRVDPARNALYCVREDHRGDGEAHNTIVRLALEGPNDDGGSVVVDGPDFVSAPRLSADGSRLAWLQWSHPNMPWDSTELWVGDLDARGGLTSRQRVAGGEGVAVTEPRWAQDGRLLLLSDETGWANLYAVQPGAGAPAPLVVAEVELGWPQWVFDRPSYGLADDGTVVCSWFDRGVGMLGTIGAEGDLTELPVSGTAYDHIRVEGSTVVGLAHHADGPPTVFRLVLGSGSAPEVLQRESGQSLPDGLASRPEAVTWTNPRGEPVHGFWYAPANAGYRGPASERPPLVVRCHGGPTAITVAGSTLDTAYWTSRGLGVLDVNYGGSTGYGRAYRERLRGRWGVVDIEDVTSGALALAERGLVDRARLAVRGGSAGGFTTLAALTGTDVFTAGASYYGVGDLELLARDTHKFESRYLDSLVAPYPEGRQTYVERSPIHHVDALSAPMILLQGLEDRVVPPSQARDMAAAVRAKGLPVALLEFDGEGHGFRDGATIRRARDAESYFYSKVFGYQLADSFDEPPVDIDNL